MSAVKILVFTWDPDLDVLVQGEFFLKNDLGRFPPTHIHSCRCTEQEH